MTKKALFLFLGIAAITFFLAPVQLYADLETPLVVGSVSISNRVAYHETHWYNFPTEEGKGYCVTISGAKDIEATVLDQNLAAIGEIGEEYFNTETKKIWVNPSVSGILHLAVYGIDNPSAGYTVQVTSAPYLSSITPASGSAGVLVTLNGTGFGNTRGKSVVKFGSIKATDYSSWQDTRIKVYVPSNVPQSGTLAVTAVVNGVSSNALNFILTLSSEGTMWKYDLARTANCPNGPTNLPLNLKWKYYTGWATGNSPTIANNIVYLNSGGYGDGLYALNANTGAFKWRFLPTGLASPAVAGGIVYSIGDDTLYAIDANTGILRWKFITPSREPSYSTPAVFNNRVYFSTKYKFYALDAITGKVKWSYKPSGQIYGDAFAIAKGLIYFGDTARNVYAINANTGTVKWTYTLTNYSMHNQTPVVADGVLYFGASWAGASAFFALDANNGALKWQKPFSCSYLAVSNGILYISQAYPSYGKIYALDAKTGATKWSIDIGGTGLVVSRGLVFISSYDKNLYALDANTGSIKWKFLINGAVGVWHSPALYKGKVYVTSNDGYLYCFGQ